MTKRCHYLPLVATVVLAGCAGNRSVQTEAAVRQGVIDYLSKRSDINLSSMQVDVTAVSFRQNEADATVAFRPKGAGANAGMTMRYTLERQGSRWVVKGRGRGQAGGHGMGQMPGGMGQMPGGMGRAPGGAGAGNAAGEEQGAGLPPGHPPVGATNPSGSKK